jgi:hypothetical protein
MEAERIAEWARRSFNRSASSVVFAGTSRVSPLETVVDWITPGVG